MKTLILDSGPIINFSMNGLLPLIRKLDSIPNVEIMITLEVKREIIDHPIKIPRFELGALKAQRLIEDKTLKLPKQLNIPSSEIKSETSKIMSLINTSLKADGKYIKIVSEAECSCLALSKILTKKGIENIIAIDERTTRTIFEKPENLEKLMSKKLRKHVKLVNRDFLKFGKFKFIRSSELVFVAHKLGLTELKHKRALEALLYATKYKGSSISYEEIKALKKLR